MFVPLTVFWDIVNRTEPNRAFWRNGREYLWIVSRAIAAGGSRNSVEWEDGVTTVTLPDGRWADFKEGMNGVYVLGGRMFVTKEAFDEEFGPALGFMHIVTPRGDLIDGRMIIRTRGVEFWLDESFTSGYKFWDPVWTMSSELSITRRTNNGRRVWFRASNYGDLWVQLQDGTSGRKQSIRVNVFSANTRVSVSIKPPGTSVLRTGGTVDLTALVSPAGSDQRVTWSLTEGNAVTVNPVTGRVTASRTATGRATVTATSVSGVSGEISLRVLSTAMSCYITYVNDGKMLTLSYEGGNTPTLTRYALGGFGKNNERIWVFERTLDDGFIIKPKNNPDLCLTANGNRVLLREFADGDTDQVWEVEYGLLMAIKLKKADRRLSGAISTSTNGARLRYFTVSSFEECTGFKLDDIQAIVGKPTLVPEPAYIPGNSSGQGFHWLNFEPVGLWRPYISINSDTHQPSVTLVKDLPGTLRITHKITGRSTDVGVSPGLDFKRRAYRASSAPGSLVVNGVEISYTQVRDDVTFGNLVDFVHAGSTSQSLYSSAVTVTVGGNSFSFNLKSDEGQIVTNPQSNVKYFVEKHGNTKTT
jgi:hypothetical protein